MSWATTYQRKCLPRSTKIRWYLGRTVISMDTTKGSVERVHNSVTLAHYKSGATGVEMQYANVTIYYSPTYSYAEYEQSKGRTHRNGQTKKCIYYRFYSVGTIEKKYMECIAQKKDFSESLWIKNY